MFTCYSNQNLSFKLVFTRELTENENILKYLLELLPEISNQHSPNSKLYKFIEKISKFSRNFLFGPNQNETVELGDICKIKLLEFNLKLNLADQMK